MQAERSNRNLVNLVLKGVAVAMGVAVVVLQVLGTATPSTLIMLLGIGLFTLALGALQAE